MKYILLLILINFLTFCFSQDTTSIKTEGDMFTLDIIYGHLLLKNSFNSKFNSQTDFKFSNPIQTIGVSVSGAYTRTHRHDYAAHYSYSQVIPQQILLNDTLNCKINGFVLSVNLFGIDLLPKSKIANCIVGFGFNTGRFRISNNEYISQKNPFFSPTVFFQPKILIGPIVLSVRADYGFDISKSSWRSVQFTNKNNGMNLNPLKQTGGIIYFSIGWVPYY
jgi:hypothetical protein